MADHPLSEERFPDVQSELPLAQQIPEKSELKFLCSLSLKQTQNNMDSERKKKKGLEHSDFILISNFNTIADFENWITTQTLPFLPLRLLYP